MPLTTIACFSIQNTWILPLKIGVAKKIFTQICAMHRRARIFALRAVLRTLPWFN